MHDFHLITKDSQRDWESFLLQFHVLDLVAIPRVSNVNVTVAGAPWTSGTVAIGASTAHGFSHGPASHTSSTARASGVLQLVTPIFISTNLAGDFSAVPAFGVLNLHFVPEPATLVLVGAGLLVTAAIGRR